MFCTWGKSQSNASPLQVAKAKAFLDGRDYIKPDDVKQMAIPVLSHRLILTTQMRLQKKESADLLKALILKVSIPMESGHEK